MEHPFGFCIVPPAEEHPAGTGIALQRVGGEAFVSRLKERLGTEPAVQVPFQGDDSPAACLEVQMVGSGGAAARSVVEHEMPRQAACHAEQVGEVSADALRGVHEAGQGEVPGQDGIGVDEQFIVVEARAVQLFLRTLRQAEETRALCQCLPVHLCPGGHDACRVVLQHQSVLQGALLHVCQFVVASACVVPDFQLTAEVAVGFGFVGAAGTPVAVVADACLHLEGT